MCDNPISCSPCVWIFKTPPRVTAANNCAPHPGQQSISQLRIACRHSNLRSSSNPSVAQTNTSISQRRRNAYHDQFESSYGLSQALSAVWVHCTGLLQEDTHQTYLRSIPSRKAYNPRLLLGNTQISLHDTLRQNRKAYDTKPIIGLSNPWISIMILNGRKRRKRSQNLAFMFWNRDFAWNIHGLVHFQVLVCFEVK